MAKTNSPRIPAMQTEIGETAPKEEIEMTLSNLRAKSDLWYKIQVLLYDLCNLSKCPAAKARTLCTTNEIYISAPYFAPEEAALIKNTVVSSPILKGVPEFDAEALECEEEMNTEITEPGKEPAKEEPPPKTMTIAEAITSCLQNFFAKRRASGDARPCGPHDMGPIYKAVFGIATDELKDERFLSRLRRAGLGQPYEGPVNEEAKNKQTKKKKGRKSR